MAGSNALDIAATYTFYAVMLASAPRRFSLNVYA
jgi:hypothetical protein